MLTNKVIVLTGGTEGIGFACAKEYATCGAKLVIVSNDEESIAASKELLYNNDSILYLSGDVSNEKDVKYAIEQACKKFGRIDVLHNNAGITYPSRALHETTEHEWDQLMNVNVKSIYYTTRYALKELQSSKGCILNTSSLVGEIGQEAHAAYVASKGAINALTKAMALDYAPIGIRVNAIAPAAVKTPALQKWSAEQPNSSSIEKYLDDIHPIGYCPGSDVIADVCAFLISEKARFITGAIIPVSGGAELGYKVFSRNGLKDIVI